MSARLMAFVVWAAVAASAVFWLLRLGASSPTAPAHTVAVSASTRPVGDLARVLGAAPVKAGPASAQPAEPAFASRFKLLGVAAPREGGNRSGLALIAVDGKPARGFKVGAPIEGELVLQSVHPRGAALGSRGEPPRVQLELPPLPPAATSNRPPGGGMLPPPVYGGGNPPGSAPMAPLPVAPPQPDAPLPAPPSQEALEPAPVAPPSQLRNSR
jgi:general secretion pathway protein C